MEKLKEYFSEKIEITNDNKDRINTKEMFETFCKEKNVEKLSQRKFNSMMKEMEIMQKKSNEKRYFSGIKYKQEEDEIESETTETSSETESEEIITPEPIIQNKQTKPKEYIKFKDCCLHIPTFTCIKETPELNYILTNTTDLETIKTKLLKTKYSKSYQRLSFLYYNNR